MGSNGASVINDLGDAICDGSSLFLGEGSGVNEAGLVQNNLTMDRVHFILLNTVEVIRAIGSNSLY